MSISLTKGQKISLTKDNPGLTKVIVGLGWDTNKYDGGGDFDLDAMGFMMNSNGKCPRDDCFVGPFQEDAQGNLLVGITKDSNGWAHFEQDSIIYTGDNRTGNGEGDDERIIVDLTKIPSDIERIEFAINIWSGQNFGQVDNAYIRVLNEENSEEILRYDLNEDFSIETAVVTGALYKHNGEWKFDAIGSGYQNGLKALCESYGLDIA